MTPDEVRLLDNSKCILFIRGERPVVDYKYNLLKHPNIRCTEDGGAAPYDYTAADNALDDLSGTPENYELLDMDDFCLLYTSAFEDMRLNTLRWHKETGVQGYHLVQSFAEGEVTPELAHQIGVEFAEQLLLGKYQAIVTTH